jgi:hypothetical protein
MSGGTTINPEIASETEELRDYASNIMSELMAFEGSIGSLIPNNNYSEANPIFMDITAHGGVADFTESEAEAIRSLRNEISSLIDSGNFDSKPTNYAILNSTFYALGDLQNADRLLDLAETTGDPNLIDQARDTISRAQHFVTVINNKFD